MTNKKTIRLEDKEMLKSFFNALAEVSIEKAQEDMKNERLQPLFEKDREEEIFGDEEEEKRTEKPEEDEITSIPAVAPRVDLLGLREDDISVQNLENSINSIRAGRATSSVFPELEKYFEKLDEEEKKVLIHSLISLAKIMSGAVSAEEVKSAEDRADVEILSGDDERKMREPRHPVRVGGQEDNSLPIRVGEGKQLQKERIRKLLYKD